MKDLEKYSYIEGGFKRYVARKSKSIIDEIDLEIYKYFGLSADEIKFLINFSLEFRTSEPKT